MLFTMECLLRSAAGKESRHGKCGISNPHPGSQFRLCIYMCGELSLQGMNTIVSYSAENWVFLLEVLLSIVSHWQLLDMKTRFQLYVMCCRCCGSLSACIFVIQHIEWDATINGNSLLDFWSCSCFTLRLILGEEQSLREINYDFFFMWDHYRGNHYKWSCVLFASTSVLL